MKSYIFKEKKFEIELSRRLSEEQPLLIEMEAAEDVIRVPIIISKGVSFRGVSTQKSGVSYFGRSSVLPPSNFVIFENEGRYTTLLCLTQGASISGGADEWLLTATEGGRLLLCVQGKNLYETVKLTMRYALQLVGEEVERPPLPKCFQTLGWESGLSYGKYVTQEKVLSAVCGMRQQGIQLGFVTIGDGWQDASRGFDADQNKFPLGLQEFVEELHRAGVEYVGVEFGEQEYGDLIQNDLGKCFEFFNEYYGYLKKQGIAYVKCIGTSQNIQTAMKAAASIHFKVNRCVSNRKFYRSNADRAQSVRDILLNSLWLQHCENPDFHSWMTHSKNGLILAMFHALSGSLMEISDLPGQSDVDLLKKIVLPNGQALKADQTLTVCRDSVFVNPCEEEIIYKAFTKKGSVGIVGVFNLHSENKMVFGSVSPKDVEGIIGDKFVVYSDRNGILGVVSLDEQLEVTLKPNQSDIFTFIPLKNGLALIGSPSFFLTHGCIKEVSIEEESMHFSSMVTAPVILYSEREIFEIKKNGSAVPWEYDVDHRKLTIDPQVEVQTIPATYSIHFD